MAGEVKHWLRRGGAAEQSASLAQWDQAKELCPPLKPCESVSEHVCYPLGVYMHPAKDSEEENPEQKNNACQRQHSHAIRAFQFSTMLDQTRLNRAG